MKILLDENIDVNFKHEFIDYTVKDNGWRGIENGELLKLAIENNYNVFITLDSNLRYQQNLSKYKIFILVLKLKDSRLTNLKLITPKIKSFLDNLKFEDFEVVEISI